MKKKIILLIIFLGLGIFFVWFSIKDFKPEDVQHIKESAEKVLLHPENLIFIFISIVFAVAAHYFRTLRNILLIDPLGYRVRKTTAFYSVMVCYLANLAIPRLGEVLRCTFLQRYDKVPFQKSFGTIVVERAFDLLVFVILLVIVIFLNKGLLSGFPLNKEGMTLGNWIDAKGTLVWSLKYIILGVLLVGLIVLFFVRHKKRKQETAKKQSKIAVKIKNIISGLWQGLISVKDLKHPYLFIIYTIAIWVCYYLGGYFCFFAFDFLKALGDQMPMAALVVLAVGSIGFMIAQGGLGAYPLIVTGVLMLLYNVEERDGFTAGWIGWSAQTIMILVVGFTTLILSSFLKVEDRAVKTSNDSLSSSV